MGQGLEQHLITQVTQIPVSEQSQWKRIDAQLCAILWQSIDPKLLVYFLSYKTCFAVWEKARKLYTNDIQRLYNVVHNVVNLKQQDSDMVSYLGKVQATMEEFKQILPI